VLDVCSGSGGSALPAAEQVGPHGKVIAADLAERLIALAEAKAEAKRLENIEFRVADMLDLGYPDDSFDAVVCVFGVFFVPDMNAAVKELWRMVKPGGRLAITTWGPNLFEPANGTFWDAIHFERPDLHRAFNPWDRISEPDGLGQMLAEAGIHDVDIQAETGTHPLNEPEDWWKIAMGSGYRGTLEQLDTNTFKRVRQGNLSRLFEERVTVIETNVIYAIATKG
jgi:ubiquinone/menaquinone biosynthesis C-methylase UbiE